MTKMLTAVLLHNRLDKDSPVDVIDGLDQANWIADLVSEFGYKVIKLPFSPDTITYLDRLKRETDFFVINLVDSAPGEENLVYLIPALLDYQKITYTGSTHDSLFITTNKVYTKKRLTELGIRTPQYVYGNEDSGFCSGCRYIIKALSEDASIGLDEDSVVLPESLEDLKNAIKQKERQYCKTFFAEKFIQGREFNACIYGSFEDPIVLPPYEWIFEGFEELGKENIFNYTAKWVENTYEYDNVKAFYDLEEKDSALVRELEDISRKCWKGFGIKGYARVDFRIDLEGRPWVLEVNCNPSFYGFHNVAKLKGLDFNDILKKIVELGTEC